MPGVAAALSHDASADSSLLAFLGSLWSGRDPIAEGFVTSQTALGRGEVAEKPSLEGMLAL